MIGSLAFHLYQYFFGDGNNIRERFPMNDEESFAFSFKGLLLNVFLSLFTDFLVIFIFSYSIKSGINTGIITALFSFSTIFTSIIFSNFYGEKLNPTHKFGILMMFICSICITIGSLNKETSSDSTYISNSDILFTIMLASIAPVLFSVKSAVFRYNSDNGVNPKY
jgi:drug/metabolite transporter (DMT)-like permease